jgi:hypothetical protein
LSFHLFIFCISRKISFQTKLEAGKGKGNLILPILLALHVQPLPLPSPLMITSSWVFPFRERVTLPSGCSLTGSKLPLSDFHKRGLELHRIDLFTGMLFLKHTSVHLFAPLPHHLTRVISLQDCFFLLSCSSFRSLVYFLNVTCRLTGWFWYENSSKYWNSGIGDAITPRPATRILLHFIWWFKKGERENWIRYYVRAMTVAGGRSCVIITKKPASFPAWQKLCTRHPLNFSYQSLPCGPKKRRRRKL